MGKSISILKRMFKTSKRVFTVGKVPVISPLGKLLLDSEDSEDIIKAVRLAVQGISTEVKLSQSTVDKIKILNDK